MLKRCLIVFLVAIFFVSCKKTYFYEETTFLPNFIYNPRLDNNHTVNILHSWEIKAKDDEEAKQRAEQSFQNRAKVLHSRGFDSEIINGYTLKRDNFNGWQIASNSKQPGVGRINEPKEKAYDRIDFGDGKAKVKDYYQVTERNSRQGYTYFQSNNSIVVTRLPFLNSQYNYYLDTKTVTTKVIIKDNTFIANFEFWQDQLFKVNLLSAKSYSSFQDACYQFFQIRDILYLANGFPSWIDRIKDYSGIMKEDESFNTILCGWEYTTSNFSLGILYENNVYKIAYSAVSSRIEREMEATVNAYAKDAISKSKEQNKAKNEEAAQLF